MSARVPEGPYKGGIFMTFGEYDHSLGVNFSTYRRISVAEKSKVDIEINVKQFKFNEALSTLFQVPKNYKRR